VLGVAFFVVTATVDIVQWYCVFCGVYCGYSNSRYSAMVLCCVWSLLWLQQQYIYCNGTVLCVEFIMVTATLHIVQCYCVLCGVYCC